jgi:DNA (cytosine-5)-methyltransferase 1
MPRKASGTTPLSVVGLFSGIGGLELGLKRAGHETKLLCEVDPAARAVLADRFKDVRIVDDIADLKVLPSGTDLVVGGFPCQDLSQVGRTAGLNGSKSSIVSQVFRLLETRPVEWVLLENVPFMLHLNGGGAIKAVLANLQRLGYRWAYRVVDTRAFGIPHRRERLFILAARTRDPRTVLFSDDEEAASGKDEAKVACGFYWTEGNRGIGWGLDCIPPLKGGSGLGIPSAPAILDRNGRLLIPDIRDAERLQGFPEGWTRAAKEKFDRQRWRLVGNAVSVPVATWLGRGLKKPGLWAQPDEPTLLNGRWPRAAWSEDRKAYAAEVSTWPKRFKYTSLSSFLRFSKQKLSRRAASGFLSRLNASTLNASDRLHDALKAHIAATEDGPATGSKRGR